MLSCAEMLNSVKVYLIVKILDSVMSRLPSEHQKRMHSCDILLTVENVLYTVHML